MSPEELLTQTPPPAPAAAVVALRKEDLHASVSDPVLDTMNFLNEVTARYPDAISFAPGRPYDGFFDAEQIFTSLRRYLDHLEQRGNSPAQIRGALFQYGPTAGRIRDLIAESLRLDEDIDAAPEAIVVTVGCQEAMLLTLRALISGPRDVLLVSSPCYVGITGAARILDIALSPVEEGPEGFRCAALEAVVLAERARGRRPRAFYIVPDHANPLGTTMPLETRRELLNLAARLDLLIIEDSPYRLVSPGRQLPSLKALDRRTGVVLLGSFSKTLFPGARVGFAVADQPVIDADGRTGLLADELTKIKSMVTVNTSALSQAVVAGMLLSGNGGGTELNRDTSAYYGQTMQSTLARLEEHFPTERREALGVRWNAPSGGFFLTVRVPFLADNAALARSAGDHGVIWTPLSYFYPEGGGTHEIRLSTSYLTDAEIVEGVARLARFIEIEAKEQPSDLPPQHHATERQAHRRDQGNPFRAKQAPDVGVDVPMTLGLNLDRPRNPQSPPDAHIPHSPDLRRDAGPGSGETRQRYPARIVGVGTAVTPDSYTQRELLDLFRITDPKIRSVFLNSAIERRHLTIPPVDADGVRVEEIQGELLTKHKRVAVDMGSRALLACLDDMGATLDDLDYLCCVTTTGFLTPGLSARIIRDLRIEPGCHRVDVVGMGCNAGLNALNGTAAWAAANPGRLAVMVCAEACSAAYVFDSTMRTAVVNSLFGDGAAAVAMLAPRTGAGGDGDPAPAGSSLLAFASHIITDAIDAMRYDWDDEQNRFSFYLDPEVPYVVGAHAERVVDRLLSGASLRRGDIRHWLLHSGGKKVIDAVRVNLGLTRHDVRHTTGVLRDYGNLSSGSFLFSYDRLLKEKVAEPGDYGVLMTMGPGSTIETALIQW